MGRTFLSFFCQCLRDGFYVSAMQKIFQSGLQLIRVQRMSLGHSWAWQSATELLLGSYLIIINLKTLAKLENISVINCILSFKLIIFNCLASDINKKRQLRRIFCASGCIWVNDSCVRTSTREDCFGVCLLYICSGIYSINNW